MITSWDVYWITRLDAIGIVLGIFVTIFTVLSIFAWIPTITDDFVPEIKRFYKLAVVVLIVSLLGFAFIPSTKEAAAIYMIPKIVNNEQVQKLPDNAMKFLNGKFEEWINDMADKKKADK
jgi:hypothetical protein